METTDWDMYGAGVTKNAPIAMAHCGYEPTAADIAVTNPLKSLVLAFRGIRTSGPYGAGNPASGATPRRVCAHSRMWKRC